MKKYVLYTDVFGRLGKGRAHDVSTPSVDKICYTDIKDFTFRDYQIKQMNLSHISPIPVRQQRYAKVCIPDEIFDNYEYSIYVDRKHPMAIDFNHLLSCLEPGSDFLITKHKNRDCIYDEGEKCIKVGKDDEKSILKQLDFYKSDGYPVHNGLYATYWLFRRHTERLKELSKLWWAEIKDHSFRDQLSLPYVVWKYDMKMSLNRRIE